MPSAPPPDHGGGALRVRLAAHPAWVRSGAVSCASERRLSRKSARYGRREEGRAGGAVPPTAARKVMSRSRTSAPPAHPPARMPAYSEHARSYERDTGAFQHYREAIVGALPACPGHLVLDVGCGTGLCCGLLRDKVGAQGEVVGIEESPEMAAVAREHIAAEGWGNVTVVQSRAEDAEIAVDADAALSLRRPRHLAVHGRAAERHEQPAARGVGGRRRRQVGRAGHGGREHAGENAPRSLRAELRRVRPAVEPISSGSSTAWLCARWRSGAAIS